MNTNENNIQLETINNYINLYNNLNDVDLKYSKDSFLEFVYTMAPTLVSDWKMGRHIEVISKKLQQLSIFFKLIRLLLYK